MKTINFETYRNFLDLLEVVSDEDVNQKKLDEKLLTKLKHRCNQDQELIEKVVKSVKRFLIANRNESVLEDDLLDAIVRINESPLGDVKIVKLNESEPIMLNPWTIHSGVFTNE